MGTGQECPEWAEPSAHPLFQSLQKAHSSLNFTLLLAYKGALGCSRKEVGTPRSRQKTPHRASCGYQCRDHSSASTRGGSDYPSTSGEHLGQRAQDNREQTIFIGLVYFDYSRTLGNEPRHGSLLGALPSPCQSFLCSPQWPQGRGQPPLFDPHNLLRTQRGLIASATFQVMKLRPRRL